MSLKRLTKQSSTERKVAVTAALAESTFEVVASGLDTVVETAIQNKITQLGSAIADVSAIVDLPQKLVNLENTVNAANSSVSVLSEELNEIQATNESFTALSSNFTLLFSDLAGDVQDAKIQVESYSERLATVEQAYTSLLENTLTYQRTASNLQASFSSITTEFSNLSASVTNLNNRTNFVESAVTTFNSEVSNLASSVSNLSSLISTTQSEVANLRTEALTKIDEEVARAQTAETALGARVTSLEAKFVTSIISEGTQWAAANNETVIINLPTPESFIVELPTSASAGNKITIKDGNGSADIAFISVSSPIHDIDGGRSLLLKEKYSYVTLVFNGTQWNVIAAAASTEKFSDTFLLMGAV